MHEHTYKMYYRHSAAQNSLAHKWDWSSHEVQQHRRDLIQTIYVCLHKWQRQMSEEMLIYSGISTPTWRSNFRNDPCHGGMTWPCVIFQKCSLPSFILASSVWWPRFDTPWSTDVTHVDITADRLYTHTPTFMLMSSETDQKFAFRFWFKVRRLRELCCMHL